MAIHFMKDSRKKGKERKGKERKKLTSMFRRNRDQKMTKLTNRKKGNWVTISGLGYTLIKDEREEKRSKHL